MGADSLHQCSFELSNVDAMGADRLHKWSFELSIPGAPGADMKLGA